MTDLPSLDALTCSRRLAEGECTAQDLVQACWQRIQATDGAVRAFLHHTPEQALQAAEGVDRRRRAGEALSPLAGVPLAIKDNIVTAGVRTTAASRLLEHWVPPYDATVSAKLASLGLPSLGKLNMDEFAMGSSCENSAFGATRNPWDLSRVPGGSSGGSAAAVAAGQVPWALGTDTGGSIRQPASFCGLVGMKPTYGRVSRYGLIAFASSLDQIGPLTRTVRDNALLLEAIAGHDPRDATSLNVPPPDLCSGLETPVKGLRVGVIDDLMGDGIAPEVRQSVEQALEVLASLGAEVGRVTLPHTHIALPTYYVIATAEASSNLARYDGVRYGSRSEDSQDLNALYTGTRALFGAEVKRRIMLGTYALAAGYYEAYYKKALQLRTLIVRDYAEAFARFDVLISPTTPTTAFKLGEKVDDPLAMYLADLATIPVNLAGLPALSLPCGADRAGLPIGLQMIGRSLDEATLYRLAYAYEQATDHHRRRPPEAPLLAGHGVELQRR
ncbi:MAG: Asp-tRNA(Asn)/Glu-tRNA(Gln) amidotransferase subunit GatA [Candidatus Sericytochromatia bacterium]|nr:Asp-tRNA(Asn)/Glu-tRNA(Gln) amidotransferase subunit GatA [Candidatus Sericytochromatia bacterium]